MKRLTMLFAAAVLLGAPGCQKGDSQLPDYEDMSTGEALSHEMIVLGKKLDEALRSIPLHHAVAAICRYGYNQPYAEVGGRLGKSPDTARKYAARGIKELKDKMK